MNKINYEQSAWLAERVGALPKNCWRNAYQGLHYIPGATYIEGWVLTPGSRILAEHGWLEHEGQIIDPTYVVTHSASELGQADYFAGKRYSKDEATELKRQQKGKLPLVWAYGWGGGDCPEYMAAHDQALSALMSYEQQRRPE